MNAPGGGNRLDYLHAVIVCALVEWESHMFPHKDQCSSLLCLWWGNAVLPCYCDTVVSHSVVNRPGRPVSLTDFHTIRASEVTCLFMASLWNGKFMKIITTCNRLMHKTTNCQHSLVKLLPRHLHWSFPRKNVLQSLLWNALTCLCTIVWTFKALSMLQKTK